MDRSFDKSDLTKYYPRLTADAAEFFDNHHTVSFRIGIRYPIGTIDVWYNGKFVCQPGCHSAPHAGECDYMRSIYFWLEIVSERNQAFLARKEESWETVEENRNTWTRKRTLRHYFQKESAELTFKVIV